MLVLTRKRDQRIAISPRAEFAAKLVELLKTHCPDLEEFHFHQIGSALVALKDHPLFQIETLVVELCHRRNDVRLGFDADEAWQILRREVLERAG